MPDFTQNPSIIVNQAYDISGNEGRKLVRLENGWLVCIAYDSTNKYLYVYKSEDFGSTWTQLCYIYHVDIIARASIVSSGTNITILVPFGGTTNSVYSYTFDATVITNINLVSSQYEKIVDSAQNAVRTTSLALDSNGVLHACWLSKNSTYPASFNIRYAKSTDGGTTWSNVSQVTKYNSNTNNWLDPCLVTNISNEAIIISGYTYSDKYIINILKETGLNTDLYINWTYNNVYNGNVYTQTNPSAVVDSNGTIHVAWVGQDSVDNSVNNLRYSYSSDNGVTWSAIEKLTSGNTKHMAQRPSITCDKNNNIYIVFMGLDSTISSYYQQIRIIKKDVTLGWGSITSITSNTTNHAWHPSACVNYKYFEQPLVIWQDAEAGDIKFYGKWDSLQVLSNLTLPSNPFSKETIDYIRTKVNEFRVQNGLSEYQWTNPTIVKGSTPIRAIHWEEIQNAILEVYNTLGQTFNTSNVQSKLQETILPKNKKYSVFNDLPNRINNIVKALKNE